MAKDQSKKDDLYFVTDLDTMKGFENITQETMAIPFIRILQSLSPQLNKNESEYIDDAEEGEFFNTVTKECYGDTINVIVLKFDRIYIEWLPDRGGFVNYHTRENAERLTINENFGKWKTEEGNDLQENYVYILLIDGQEAEGVVVLSLASTMIKKAREWNRLMTTHILDTGARAKPFYLVWELKTEYQSNDKGNWYSFSIKFNKYINKEQYDLLTLERKALPDTRIDYSKIEANKETETSENGDVPF